MHDTSWVETVDVSVSFDEEEFSELLFTSRGFIRLHADTKFGRESHVRTVMDEVIAHGDRGVLRHPVVLSHPYRVWIDFNKVLKRGLGPGPEDEEHRELRMRIAKRIDFSVTQVGSRVTLRQRETQRERSAERVERLGSKELYNYGTLLALAEEQNAARGKSSARDLDWWEKKRMDNRSDAIARQLLAIGRLKAQQGFTHDLGSVLRSDLDSISDVGLVGRRYSEGAFKVLEESLRSLEGEFHWVDSSQLPRIQ